MADGVIGEVHVFQALFVDATGAPLAVNNPTISVFNFSTLGVKQSLASGAMDPADPVELGRYTYPYTIPTTIEEGDTLYAEMTGVDPGSGDTLRVNQQVDTITVRGDGGLVATVVKPL